MSEKMMIPLRTAGFLVLLFLAVTGGSAQTPVLTYLGNLDQYSFEGYNDCWGYTAPDGKEYALLGVTTGTSIIDITDPNNLHEISFFTSSPSPWKDIKTYRHYAYVVTDQFGVGLQILDLSTLPDSASFVRSVNMFLGTPFSTSHNIYIDTTRALLYMEGDAAMPVRLWSLADPENPVGVTSFGPVGFSIHDIYARGDTAYISEGTGGTFGIYDVSDSSQPALLKSFTSPSGGYAHNAWLSDDGKYLMTTEETPGRTVKYWDISDLKNVQLKGQYLGSTLLAHNTHIKGRYAYISHYKDGLKIVDLIDPTNPTEVASYNTFIPNDDPYLYQGAWGAYPFFASGKILISDMQRGLFVVSFPPAAITDVPTAPASSPVVWTLDQNYPNPFNPSTRISFSLPNPTIVRLSVYDLLGREIALLASGPYATGSHTVTWDARGLPTGMYLYTLRTEEGTMTRHMVLAK